MTTFSIVRAATTQNPVLELAGEIDIASVDVLEQTALQCLAAEPHTLTIDLDGVTFLDSAGLNALVVIYRATQQAGVRLYARRIPERIARLLSLTSLDTLFETESDHAAEDHSAPVD